jgi:hypothetical protein
LETKLGGNHMKNKWMIAVLFFLIMPVFDLSSVYASDALEGNAILDCDKRIIVETIPGEYNNNQLHPPNPLQLDPSNPTTITCGTPRTISVLDGCPPFNWSVSGTGYTLTDVPGNERSKILNCSGGT